MPAWRSRCAAANPEAPAPTTAQRNVPPTSRRCHDGERGSVPASASSSDRNASQCSVAAAPPTRKPKAWRSSSGASVRSGVVLRQQRRRRQPPRRLPPARAVSPRPGTSICSWSGANSGRSSDRSPVRCATAHRSGCTSATAKAAATRCRVERGRGVFAGVRVGATPSHERAAYGGVRRSTVSRAPCAWPARSSGCSPRPYGAACPWPAPGSRRSSGRRCPPSRRSTTRRRSRPCPRTR